MILLNGTRKRKQRLCLVVFDRLHISPVEGVIRADVMVNAKSKIVYVGQRPQRRRVVRVPGKVPTAAFGAGINGIIVPRLG